MAQVNNFEGNPDTRDAQLVFPSPIAGDVSDQGATSPRSSQPITRYPCPYSDDYGCQRTFTTRQRASAHSSIHTMVKNIPCTFRGCRKKFARTESMEQHYKTHYKNKSPSPGQQDHNPALVKAQKSSPSGSFIPVPCPDPRPPTSGPSKVIAFVGRRELEEQAQIESFKDSGEGFPLVCVTCNNRITALDISQLYCPKHHQAIDQLSKPPAATPFPSKQKKGKRNQKKKGRKKEDGVQFVCKGDLDKGQWGCGSKFSECNAFAWHLQSEKGRDCIKQLVHEERSNEDLTDCPVDPGQFPLKLLRQYPELVHYNWDSYSIGDHNDSDHVSNHMARVGPSSRPGWVEEAKATTPRKADAKVEPSTKKIDHGSTCEFKEPLRERLLALRGRRDTEFPSQEHLSHLSQHEIDTQRIENVTKVAHRQVLPETSVGRTLTKTPLQSGHITEGIPFPEEPSGQLESHSESSGPEGSKEEPTGSDHSLESSIISTLLEGCWIQVIDRLMNDFEILIDQSQVIRSRGSSEGSSSRSSSHHMSAIELSGVPYRQQKRGRDESDESDHPSGNRGNDGSKRAMLDTLSLTVARRFACPYYRRNPQKHKKHRSCAGPGWTTLHRVKEHIYRQHELPIHCPRCYAVFTTERHLTTHQRLPEVCQVRTVELLEGFTKEQEKRLRQRKKSTGSDEDQWKHIYRILFPNDSEDMIPTPYYDIQEVHSWGDQREKEFDQFEQYFRLELPRVVRRRLEEAVAALTEPYAMQFHDQLVEIVRDAQSQLFRTYRWENRMREGSETSILSLASEAHNQHPFLDFSVFPTPSPVLESHSCLLADNAWNGELFDGENHQQTWDLEFGSGSSNFLSMETDNQVGGSIMNLIMAGNSEKCLGTNMVEEAAD